MTGRHIFALCLPLGACAQLAGIDETNGDGRVGVSLSVERASIGSTVIRAPQDLSANTATYLVPDELDPSGISRVAAVETDVGLWTAEIFDATPPVLFDLPERPGPPVPHLWDFPNQDVLVGFDVLEHPGATAIDPMSTLAVNVTLDRAFVVAESFELFVVGTWTQRALTAPAAMALTLAEAAFPVSSMGALTGRPAERITVADTAVVLRRTGTKLDGRVDFTPFDETGPDMLTGTMTAVVADKMLDIQIGPAIALTRFGAARPAVGTPAFGWELHAAPGANELVTASGPRLENAAALVTDTMVQITYGNPFEQRSWPTVLSWNASATRTTTPPGQALPVTLASGMNQTVAEPTPAQLLDFPAGLPQLISINGTALSIDNDVVISAPTTSVEVTVVTDRTSATFSRSMSSSWFPMLLAPRWSCIASSTPSA